MLSAWLMGLTALAGSGCGTVCNFAGGLIHPDTEPRVYGGVQRDLEVIEGLSSKPLFPNGFPTSPGNGAGAALVFGGCLAVLVADPLLSFLGDTLTLPLTAYVQHCREASSGSPSAEELLPGIARPTPPVLGEPWSVDPGKAEKPGPDWLEHVRLEMVRGLKPPAQPEVNDVPPPPPTGRVDTAPER
jgi:hypothetical protein